MSIEGQNIQTVSAVSTGAIAENSFVKVDADDTAYPAGGLKVEQAGAGDAVFGVACNGTTIAGQAVTVCVAGVGKHIIAGGTPNSITVGSQVASDANGAAVKDATALANVGGVALGETNTAAATVPIIVQPYSTVKAAS